MVDLELKKYAELINPRGLSGGISVDEFISQLRDSLINNTPLKHCLDTYYDLIEIDCGKFYGEDIVIVYAKFEDINRRKPFVSFKYDGKMSIFNEYNTIQLFFDHDDDVSRSTKFVEFFKEYNIKFGLTLNTTPGNLIFYLKTVKEGIGEDYFVTSYEPAKLYEISEKCSSVTRYTSKKDLLAVTIKLKKICSEYDIKCNTKYIKERYQMVFMDYHFDASEDKKSIKIKLNNKNAIKGALNVTTPGLGNFLD